MKRLAVAYLAGIGITAAVVIPARDPHDSRADLAVTLRWCVLWPALWCTVAYQLAIEEL